MVKVYDQMRVMYDKPKDPLWGTHPSQLVTYWGMYDYDPVNKQYLVEKGISEAAVKAAAEWYKKREPLALLVLDNEEFDFHQSILQKSSAIGFRELKKLLNLYRKYYQGPLGFYGEFPERSYEDFKDPKTLEAWDAVTDVSVAVIGDELDFVAPSLYTYTKDRDGWFAFAEANIKMSKKFNLPIKAYLWPRYYTPSQEKYAGTMIEYDFFLAQMKFCAERDCDIILWDTVAEWTGKDSHKAILDFLGV